MDKAQLERQQRGAALILSMVETRLLLLPIINAWMDTDETNDVLLDNIIKALNGGQHVQ